MDKKPDTINKELTAADAITFVDNRSLKEKVYIVRGVQVMLDFELAEIYGYETSSFNQQVKRNANKFDEDFMFQLTKEEFQNLMSQNVISSWGGRRKLPNAFTEQGIYMLMTVLHGPLATRQSKMLIRLFKGMKDYIAENQPLLSGSSYAQLSYKIESTEKEVSDIKANMLTKADLPEFMKLFDQGIQNEEILILDGQPFKADVAYQKIYRSAKRSIIIVDDYIGVKTLNHLVHAKPGVKLTIISDNKLRLLKLSEYNDFLKEYPTRAVDFIRSKDRTHDRYIVLDNDTAGMKIYHCGASSKDAGKRITTITLLSDAKEYKGMIDSLLKNDKLILK